MFNTDMLKKVRLESKKSQQEIADILGVGRSAYAMWESNNNIIPINRLIDFCIYFNVSLDYILEFSNEIKYKNLKNKIELKLAGQRLKEFRKNQNMTQEKLAEKLNVARTIISKYEKGEYLISTHAIYTICKKYHVSADYLLGRIDEPKTY